MEIPLIQTLYLNLLQMKVIVQKQLLIIYQIHHQFILIKKKMMRQKYINLVWDSI